MYGLVNKAVEGLVCSQFGEETWEKIKSKAGVTEVAFVSNKGYPDSLTYDLVAAASEVLGMSSRDILIAFGEYWVLETARKSYGELMTAGGSSLPEFLQKLPNFHARVSLIFPKLKPPSFRVSEVTERSLRLHYSSHREGLEDFVVGLVQGLGKMFETPATCRLIESGGTNRNDSNTWTRYFHVEWEEAA